MMRLFLILCTYIQLLTKTVAYRLRGNQNSFLPDQFSSADSPPIIEAELISMQNLFFLPITIGRTISNILPK